MALLAAPCAALAAQDAPQEPPLAGRAMLSASYARGNTESERLYGDAQMTARSGKGRIGASGRVERRTEPGLAEATSWLAGANYDRFLSRARFGYVRGSLEHDTAKDIDRRSALGAGLGADLFAAGPFTLSVRGGPEYVRVDRFAAPDEDYPALGWGLKAGYKPAGPKGAELFHEQEGFWNLEEGERLFVRSKSGLRVPLVARLSASIQINIDWERRPAPERRATDSMLLIGVDYSF